jgi:DNA-binding Lrp family transcriptional regulator
LLDKLDLLLLTKLQNDARKPISQLARELGKPTPTIRDRVKRLENKGIIREYSAVIDVSKLGFPIKALIHVSVSGRVINSDEFLNALELIPEVSSVDLLTGDYEAVVVLHVHDIEHLRRLVYEDIPRVPGVTGTNTSIVLQQAHWKIPRSFNSPSTESE